MVLASLRLLLSVLAYGPTPFASYFASDYNELQPPEQHSHTKSIAIIGGGSAGLAALKVLLDVQREEGQNWEIVLYERRSDVGGVWFEDPNPPQPPKLPESPCYPLLRTNTPHPTMTYLNFTFPPNTNLYPSHVALQKYHGHFASHYNLTQYIKFHHDVVHTAWQGDSSSGEWLVRVEHPCSSSIPHPAARPFFQSPIADKDSTHLAISERRFDHLIVASGHNHYPRIPTWPGQEEWLSSTPKGSPKREILHSIFWRDPLKYAGRDVVVLGLGASGKDLALHITPVANKLYHSVTRGRFNQVASPAIPKPRISHFTRDAVHFEDGTSSSEVSAVLLGTGYELRIPFLTSGSALTLDTSAVSRNVSHEQPPVKTPLTTNLRYIRPLYRQILSLSTSFPPASLFFLGLPIGIANAPSDIAQALFVAHILANTTSVPPRLELLSELEEREEALRKAGYSPDSLGHTLVDLSGQGESRTAYQNEIIDWLKKGGVPSEKLPLRGPNGTYVDGWRRWTGRWVGDGGSKSGPAIDLRGAWARVESLGEGEVRRWLAGRETEADWAKMMVELNDWWEKNQHKEQGGGKKTE